MMFLDLIVPRSVMAGFSGRYPRMAGSIENITNVESLAKPASTLTRLTLIGIFFSQSKKISVDSSLDLTSSKIRMLSSSLGYSGRSNSEAFDGAADWFRLTRLAVLGVSGRSGDGESTFDVLADFSSGMAFDVPVVCWPSCCWLGFEYLERHILRGES